MAKIAVQKGNLLSETKTYVQYPLDKHEKQGNQTKVETREGRLRLLSDAGIFTLEAIFSQTTRRTPVTFKRDITGKELQDILEWGKLEDKQSTEQYAWLLGLVYIRHTDIEENGPGEKGCIGLKGYDHSEAMKQALEKLKEEKFASDMKAYFSLSRETRAGGGGVPASIPESSADQNSRVTSTSSFPELSAISAPMPRRQSSGPASSRRKTNFF